MRRSIKILWLLALLFSVSCAFAADMPRRPSVLGKSSKPVRKQYNNCCICHFYDGKDADIRYGAPKLCDKWLDSKACDYKLKIPSSVTLQDKFSAMQDGFKNRCESTEYAYYGHSQPAQLDERSEAIKACFQITNGSVVATDYGCLSFSDPAAVLREAERLEFFRKPGQELRWSGNQVAAGMDMTNIRMVNPSLATLQMRPGRPPAIAYGLCSTLGSPDVNTGGRSCYPKDDESIVIEAFCKNKEGHTITMLCCPISVKASWRDALFGTAYYRVFNWMLPVKGACPDLPKP